MNEKINGVPVTEEMIRSWADEAEGGYTAYPAGTTPDEIKRHRAVLKEAALAKLEAAVVEQVVDDVVLSKPAFCPRDWGMHSCTLPRDHYEPHECVCGEKKGQP